MQRGSEPPRFRVNERRPQQREQEEQQRQKAEQQQDFPSPAGQPFPLRPERQKQQAQDADDAEHEKIASEQRIKRKAKQNGYWAEGCEKTSFRHYSKTL